MRKNSIVTHALSHRDEKASTCSSTTTIPDWIDEVYLEYIKAPQVYEIIKNINKIIVHLEE